MTRHPQKTNAGRPSSQPFPVPRVSAARAFFAPAPLSRLAFPTLVLLLFLLPALSGCGKFLDPGPAPARIHLFPAMPEPSAAPAIDKQLIIDPPSSGLDIDTDSIALLFNGREVKYLSGYRWTSRAPAVFQRALVDALMANNSLRGVNTESSALSADARLVTDIKRFHLNYTDKNQPPTAEIDIVMQIINQKDGSVIDSKALQATTRAAGNETQQLMDAFESTLSKILSAAVPWIEQNMRGLR